MNDILFFEPLDLFICQYGGASGATKSVKSGKAYKSPYANKRKASGMIRSAKKSIK